MAAEHHRPSGLRQRCHCNGGKTETSPARLTLAQAFNSLGTTIGPFIGARLILGDEIDLPGDITTLARRAGGASTRGKRGPYRRHFWMIAALLVVLIVVFWFYRNLIAAQRGESGSADLGSTFLQTDASFSE